MGTDSVFLPFLEPTREKLFVMLKSTLFLSFSYVVGSMLYNIYLHPLSSYPGPKACAATRIPYFRSLVTGRLVNQVEKWHDEYGPVVRIAPDELSYASALSWKDIYGPHQSRIEHPKDPKFYSSPLSDKPDVSASDPADQTRYRRSLAQAFSNFPLRKYEPTVSKYVDMLISRLYQQIWTGTFSVDMVSWYSFTTFDIIRDLTFGEPFGCLEKSQNHPWISMVFSQIRMGVYLNVVKRVPGGKALLRFLLSKRLSSSRIKHHVLTEEGIENALSGGNDKATFLSHILGEEDPSKQLRISEVMSNASAFILAGAETTATALSGITYFLLREPETMKKLVREIRAAFDSEDDITISSVSKLRYMLAVVNESLRMYPPVPIGLTRVIEGRGAIIDGRWVPAGTSVSVSQMGAGRLHSNFSQADKFIPERYLDDPTFSSDKKTASQPFLTGPRNCVGRSLAYAEIRLILARILWNFDMKLEPESTNWTDQRTYFLWEKNPLKITLAPARGRVGGSTCA